MPDSQPRIHKLGLKQTPLSVHRCSSCVTGWLSNRYTKKVNCCNLNVTVSFTTNNSFFTTCSEITGADMNLVDNSNKLV